ncbi:hypothetical protein J2Z31_001771 [Sinorhizobium kostiense]|uniref:Uncharacterized protein n=1 Tax=Sinorhizobium kostiense TaxID=76747 RepID=A0ABS4QXS0_9HYPH|nr:hypothetical protein [Sinorhizobium kostiense]MBP2235279.1 hypothetical protein [Sinorhizobium kostiense]
MKPYDATKHYFEVTFANRPDVQSGPKRYFRHLQPALNNAAFLAGERKHVCIFEREEHGGTGDKWKAFWWSRGLQKSMTSSREAEGGGYIRMAKATMTTTPLYPYVPLDPDYRKKAVA